MYRPAGRTRAVARAGSRCGTGTRRATSRCAAFIYIIYIYIYTNIHISICCFGFIWFKMMLSDLLICLCRAYV